MNVVRALRAAEFAHRFFPFATLRTATYFQPRVPSDLVLERSLYGIPMKLRLDRSVIALMLYLDGERFVEDAPFLDPHLHPGMTVVDVGANLGHITYFLCSRVRPGGKVLALEPEAANYAELQSNISCSRLPCEVIHAAAGAAAGMVGISGEANAVVTNQGPQQCRVLALDDLFRERGFLPDLIKIDVEGYELEVLRGGEQTLRHKPVLYLELHAQGFSGHGQPGAVCELLENYYSRFFCYRPLDGLTSVGGRLQRHFLPWSRLRRRQQVSFSEVKRHPEERFQIVCLA